MEIENCKITNVSISMNDYCCLTFWITVEGAGWGCNIGGYKIASGEVDTKPENFKAENGAGLIAIMRIMDVVGVDRWEDLEGKYCRVKTEGWGDTITCIGNILKDKWFDIKEFFQSYKEENKTILPKNCPCNTCTFWDGLRYYCTNPIMEHRTDCVPYANYLSQEG